MRGMRVRPWDLARALIHSEGYNITELARDWNISRPYLNMILVGQLYPSKPIQRRFRNQFNMPMHLWCNDWVNINK